MHRNRGRVAACLAVVLLQPALVFAQQEPSEEAPAAARRPLAVIAVAGVERLVDDVEALLRAAGREELSDTIAGVLHTARDLKGMNRQRPFGVLLFLRPGLTPQPVPVAFVPVDNIDELAETVTFGELTARKVDGTDDRYELVAPQNTLHVRVFEGYAFVTNDEQMLEGELPDPAELSSRLAGRYDVAASVDVDAVPEGMRELFLGFLRTSADVELQRRDDEPVARHRLRKANGESTLAFIEQVLTQGDQLTLGFNLSGESKRAHLEAVVEARSDSELAKYLDDVGSRPSRFAGLLARPVPVSLAVSWKLDPRGQKVMSELLSVVEEQMAAQMGAGAGGESLAPAGGLATRLVGPLKTTVENGHVDLFAQFVGEPPANFALIGGMAIADADGFGQAIREVLDRLQNNPNTANVQLNVDVHQGVALHRIEGKTVNPRDERLYGAKPGLYLGAGNNTVWFAVGGDRALPALKEALDLAAEPASEAATAASAPFQIVLHLGTLVAMQPADPNNPRPIRQLARDAFAAGGDRLTIDLRPTESGARLRVEFDEAFLRLVGLAIARRIDRGQEQ